MIDREELHEHFEWLAGSECFDQALGDASLAIELTALGHGDDLMRHGYAWMNASAVVEVLGLEAFVNDVRAWRERGDRFPPSFARPLRPSTDAVPRNREVC